MDEKTKENKVNLSQNPVSFGRTLGKTGLKPVFSAKSKEAGQNKACHPKTEVLEQSQIINVIVPKGIEKQIAALAAAGNISEAEAQERIIRLGLEAYQDAPVLRVETKVRMGEMSEENNSAIFTQEKL
jgi:hypothetical protein